MRVNIESSALAEGRFNKLANELFDGSRSQAIGALVLLWFDSQEREFVRGTKDEIKKFMPFVDGSNNEFFNHLLKHDYIKEVETDIFEIAGNNRHVEKLQEIKSQQSERGKKSAEARKIKFGSAIPIGARNNRTEPEPVPNQCSDSVREITKSTEPDRTNTVQCSSVQYNSMHNTIQPKLYESWLKTYVDKTWIDQEIKKAQSWLLANPDKPKKSVSRFINNWLANGFKDYRKPISSRIFNTGDDLVKPHPPTDPKVKSLIASFRKKMPEDDNGPGAA